MRARETPEVTLCPVNNQQSNFTDGKTKRLRPMIKP